MLPRKEFDLNRAVSASSTYSTDSNRRSTYLDYRPTAEMNNKSASYKAAKDYAESLGVPPPRTPPTASVRSTSSRPSSRPSYMNYENGRAESPTPPVTIPQSTSRTSVATVTDASYEPSTAATGLLLLFLAAEVPAEMAQYLDVAFKQHPLSGIMVIGSQEQEAAVKQLKMDVYAIAGKMGRDMSVQTHLLAGAGEDDVNKAIQQATRSGDKVRAVLCSPSFGPAEVKAADILSLGQDELLHSWQLSAGYLHTVAKATIPLLLAGTTRSSNGRFLVVESSGSSPAESVNLAACEMLLRQLSIAYVPQGLTVDYAANVLVPEPERERANGTTTSQANVYTTTEPCFTPSESPTKMWHMWALQND